MKKQFTILLLTMMGCIPLISGCATNKTNTPTQEPTTTTDDNPSTGGDDDPETPPDTSPKKITVAAHTLSDTNPPINIDSPGQEVDESTWNSFKNGTASKFSNNYNFTYSAYSGGNQTTERYTKNGYFMRSVGGTLYYERKSGSTFYQYIDVSDGWLRQETTLDIQQKYTSRILDEINVHMFAFNKYEFDTLWDGGYVYNTDGFTSVVMFQGGYLTYLSYTLGMNVFEIKLSFETTIDIPKSYYYG